jgi:hypothetical protein
VLVSLVESELESLDDELPVLEDEVVVFELVVVDDDGVVVEELVSSLDSPSSSVSEDEEVSVSVAEVSCDGVPSSPQAACENDKPSRPRAKPNRSEVEVMPRRFYRKKS